MTRNSRWWRLFALLFAFALVAAACGSDDDDGGGDGATDTTVEGSESEGTETDDGETTDTTEGEMAEGSEGGTLIWAHEQEPPDLHLDDPNNNLTITSHIIQSMWEGLYGITGDTTFFPELLAEEAVITEDGDGVVISFKLREGLTWSDGMPLTSNDVKFTNDIILEGFDPETGEGGVYLFGSRVGYELITDFTVKSDTEFDISFSRPFAGYQTLFVRVMPAHAFGEGATAETVNAALPEWTNADGETLPSSGPMVFDSWERGVAVNLVRNDTYHGSTSPDASNSGPAFVDGVRVNWVLDTDAQINALKSGEAHLIFSQPQLAFGERIATDEDFTVASLAGPVWEHWGFNTLNPHLAKSEVREAVAYALDKEQVVSTLYAPLFGDLLPSEGQGNAYWMSNQPAYEDHQTEYAGAQTDKAAEKLEAAGYTKDGDFYTHPDDGQLTLRVGTTGGNALRELQQQIIQEQLKGAGIEIVIDNVPGAAYFGERPFSDESIAAANSEGAEGDPTIWDITQFAWVGGPWPGSQHTAFKTGSGNNAYAFDNADFDARSSECDELTDPGEAGSCYNELDTYVTTLDNGDDGLVVIPLTQKPSFYAYSSKDLASAGVGPDSNDAGPIVNVVDFQFK